MTPNVFTIAAGLPFAETLARGLVQRLGADRDPLALAGVTVFLPTRRATRTLDDAFARILGGSALLPRLRPLGDLDEDAFDASGLALAPAIGPLRRRLLLATLVRGWDHAKHGRATFDFAQGAQLARALAGFLDEVQTQEADLAKLDTLVPDRLALHWAEVRGFLSLLRTEWPKLLHAEGAADPAEQRREMLDALAERYRQSPPGEMVIAAGTTGSIPATARLLTAIAACPNGLVILPGLDRSLDAESWDALDPGHPQYGLKELLARIGIARPDVRDWSDASASRRSRLLSEVLRPAPTTDAWRALAETGPEQIAAGLDGLTLVETAHPGEEASTIALILRGALETPDRTAALVTPDRNLARRVAAELGRWGIAIDDSAGRPLAHSAPGAFLQLVLDVADSQFAPVPLLALLKHPLAACGRAPAECRRLARLLDRAVLRGPRPDPGASGMARAIAHAPADDANALTPWFEAITDGLSELAALTAQRTCKLPELAQAHARAAEALAASDIETGAARLWKGDAGIAAAELLVSLTTEAREIPPVEPAAYAPLFRSLSEERAVRPHRGLHPRLAILGPLEARLQSYDLLVLGGLNEGTWPRAAAADPWLSRPMREALGLASPERAIGLSAHDFATLAAGPEVVLTRARKAEGAPTVASRWLERLVQLVQGLGLRERLDSATPYAALAARLEWPGAYTPVPRPAPRPAVALRPRRLSVTEIETWLRDPYAIYARHILKLVPLDPLDAPVGALERGTAIHRILELFFSDPAAIRAPDAAQRLIAIADSVFRDEAFPKAALALWRPRFAKAAGWFVEAERERREEIAQTFVELRGTRRFAGPAGEFVLRARADRIDLLRNGAAAIIDYKTGIPPSAKQVQQLLAPQLPLEGAILAAGGFANLGPRATDELIYVRFGGGARPGDIIRIAGPAELVADAEHRLLERIAAFDCEDTPYLPRVMPYRTDLDGPYDHLARVREWSVSDSTESET